MKCDVEFFVLVLLDFSVICMQGQEDYLNLVIDLTCGINLVIVMEDILSCNRYIHTYIYIYIYIHIYIYMCVCVCVCVCITFTTLLSLSERKSLTHLGGVLLN